MSRVFFSAWVNTQDPVELSVTLCRSYLFLRTSALPLKKVLLSCLLHNPAKRQRKIQWAGYSFLLLSGNTKALPLIFLRFSFSFPVIVMRIASKHSEAEEQKNTLLRKDSRIAGKCIMKSKLIQQNHIFENSLARKKTRLWTLKSVYTLSSEHWGPSTAYSLKDITSEANS